MTTRTYRLEGFHLFIDGVQIARAAEVQLPIPEPELTLPPNHVRTVHIVNTSDPMAPNRHARRAQKARRRRKGTKP